ncbi:hypothetical protein [Methylobacterium sp. J-067]|uniref:hypothetical protein n=1 Tax=Methylobacterium sp. J-067 TaxID=2836648 RepID=UPI001FB88C13|nr:hypothetical protein [Methylobacterium sp. J-067]MCJ2023672.1 hypothetical protein [Methylobacterium sp. J-067]
MRPQSFNDWCSAIAAATAPAALIISSLAWIYPKQPAAFKMKTDKIYDDEKIIGRVSAFRIDPVLSGQYAMRVISKRKILLGDVIGFHDTHCIIIDLQNETEMPAPQIGSYLYDAAHCRILSG